MRKVFFGFTVLMFVSVIAQFYFATFGAFERPTPAFGAEDAAIMPHILNGTMVLPLLSILTTIVAAIAKAGGRLILLSITPLLLVVVQLFVIFELAAMLGAEENSTSTASLVVLGFHALDGVAILWASVVLMKKARDLTKAAAPAPQAAVA